MSRKRTNVLLGLVAIIVFVAFAAFVRERFLAARVILTNVDPEATIFVNGNKRKVPNYSGTVTLSLPIGSQEIGIDREGYWPWVKTVSLDAGNEYTFAPFIVARAVNAEGLRNSHVDYDTVRALFTATELPNLTAPLTSADGLSTIWLDSESIWYEWNGTQSDIPEFLCSPVCESPHVITTVTSQLRSLVFLPHRNDVIVLATADGVFALEADSRSIQNFQRIYKGDAPRVVNFENDLYVLDDARLVKLLFE